MYTQSFFTAETYEKSELVRYDKSIPTFSIKDAG